MTEEGEPFPPGVPGSTPEPASVWRATAEEGTAAGGTVAGEAAAEKAGVPRSTPVGDPPPSPPGPGNHPDLADALDKELAESDAFWARLTKKGIYDTEEQLRDAIDRWDWREVEAQKRLARDAARAPGRSIEPSLGTYAGRSCRQVNVKLGTPDFEALVALALDRDVPPSTMARILLRRAIVQAAGVGTER